jgi:hypothetical protein
MVKNTINMVKIKKNCIHEKQKSNCKECGGSSICPHGKIKYSCKECGGSRFCTHKKNKITM